MFRSKAHAGLLLLLVVTTLVYLNHFSNGFHFDDSHAIENNVFIRNLSNIPRFFIDGTTFSVLPLNQSYRPLVTATLAFDYWLGGGLNPLFFHLSTFLLFLAQIAAMFFLFKNILKEVKPESAAGSALFICAWYALHPVSAESVNYIIQRAEIHSTLAVVLAFLLYAEYPGLRRWGLYLLPVIAGTFSKPLTIMFAPILFSYVYLFAERGDFLFWKKTFSLEPFTAALRKSLPSFITCGALYFFQSWMTPQSYTPGGSSLGAYILTQPFVHLHYFTSIFLPVSLTADSDWGILTLQDIRAWIGFAFYVMLIAAIFFSSSRQILKPVTFGLLWFIFAQLPTSLVPLSEVMNDHRMFFPFAGLCLAAGWLLTLGAEKIAAEFVVTARSSYFLPLLSVLFLAPYAFGVYQRNEVWRSEQTLWADAVKKSPQNGRALMNYGLTLMEKGDYKGALDYYEKARLFSPNYPTLDVNLAISKAASGRSSEAKFHFERALLLAPNAASSYFYYARWLRHEGRFQESRWRLEQGLKKVPANFDLRHLLMDVYVDLDEWGKLRGLVKESLAIAPGDPKSMEMEQKAAAGADAAIASAAQEAEAHPSADNYITLSLLQYRNQEFEQSLKSAEKALEFDPSSPYAYNNIAAARASMGLWDDAIAAAEKALRLKPDFAVARNNLNWALREKNK